MNELTLRLLPSALLLIAACGGGGDHGAPASAAKPTVTTVAAIACPLDASSVIAITGLEVNEAENLVATGDGVSCTFGTDAGDTGISLTTYTSAGSVALDRVRELLGDATDVQIDWADQAIWSESQTTLQVVVGDGGAQIQITDLASVIADPLQTATELAEVAVG